MPAWPGSAEDPLPEGSSETLILVTSQGRKRGLASSLASSNKGTNPNHEGSTLRT